MISDNNFQYKNQRLTFFSNYKVDGYYNDIVISDVLIRFLESYCQTKILLRVVRIYLSMISLFNFIRLSLFRIRIAQ